MIDAQIEHKTLVHESHICHRYQIVALFKSSVHVLLECKTVYWPSRVYLDNRRMAVSMDFCIGPASAEREGLPQADHSQSVLDSIHDTHDREHERLLLVSVVFVTDIAKSGEKSVSHQRSIIFVDAFIDNKQRPQIVICFLEVAVCAILIHHDRI